MGTGHNPASVTFTERSTSATTSLESLQARKRSDGFWLFLSGVGGGMMFAKNVDGWQLLSGTSALGAVQRMGQLDFNDFVIILGDNA